ncbi:MAG: phosphoserine phosphatase SerB [Gammaproteobacteria bacterium]|nr:phosphoserine phosphatase SerB [Gammaproteobacteria bacterium]
MLFTIIHTTDLNDTREKQLLDAVPGELSQQNQFYLLKHHQPVSKHELSALRQKISCDINMLPEWFDPAQVRLLITDMDSTLISIECIDEIADFLGIKPDVAAITRAAMRGEIDFNTSLQQRVSLLKGLSADVLHNVYNERLRLNSGAKVLMTSLRNAGIKTALVSGGFTYFTERLESRLQLDYSLANQLEIIDNRLTGVVLGQIVDGSVKAAYLTQIAHQNNIPLSATIAVGDGANDLEMMNKAGLGIAYHAKPSVQQQADIVFNHSGLDAILHLLSDK